MFSINSNPSLLWSEFLEGFSFFTLLPPAGFATLLTDPGGFRGWRGRPPFFFATAAGGGGAVLTGLFPGLSSSSWSTTVTVSSRTKEEEEKLLKLQADETQKKKRDWIEYKNNLVRKINKEKIYKKQLL